MAKIIKLDQHTANLIAAGEVIERAASVVKELVENSIDANATKININLVDSGLAEITVSDNGEGMDAYDAKMCYLPHATSKIKNGNDLFRISTLGFRGEALPSIVSVSNFKLRTSSDGVKGLLLSLKAGEMVSEAIISQPKGTEITVKNLFFNTPARLQNLQSASLELSYIVDYVSKMALSKPNIAFRLVNNDKVILQTFGTNRPLEVIANIYKDEVAKNMIELFANNGYFKISGFISKLNTTRSSKNHIHLIVNDRVIKNHKLINAVVDGYNDRLMYGRYPICVIKIGVDPSLVDVNIHPAKLEVRFSNEDELIKLITSNIDYTLSQTNLIVDLSQKPDYQSDLWDLDVEDTVLKTEIEAFEVQEVVKEQSKIEALSYEDFEESDEEENLVEEEETISEEEPDDIYTQQQYSLIEGDNETDPTNSTYKLPKLFYIGQLRGTYLLAQDEDNFYLIDQHAANERINYEKIIKELKKESIITYELLIPLKLNYTPSEAIIINEKILDLSKLGFDVEDFGGGTFTVRQVPIWLPKGREKEFVEEVIFQMLNNRKSQKHQFLESMAKSLACKRSIKANEFLNPLQIEYLLEDLGKCDNPYTCPHGRPVIVKFNNYEIEKWFKRVV